ncbi:MAG: hypothetical protein KDD22_02710, partial [Bdellovibrionales bacterium]|nr:hypothetical protein [Bdellovibrionales bacterium]
MRFLKGLIFIAVSPVLFFLVSLLNPNQNYADAQYLIGPTSAAFGGAGVAAVNGSEAVYINPAALAHAPNFEGSLIYQDGYLAQDTHRTYMGATLIDNSEMVIVPGSLSYLQGSQTNPGGAPSEDQRWQMSFGGFIYRNLALGANVYWMKRHFESQPDDSMWNGAVGIHYT